MSVNPESKENQRYRRAQFTPGEWKRTHASYRALVPHRNFDSFHEDDETKEKYAERVGRGFGFPSAVLDQWLYGLYYNRHSVNNYGWIDYDTVEFDLQPWNTDAFLTLRVITAYAASFVDERAASFETVDDFMCIAKDREHWRSHGTWRVPPIAIDMDGLGDVPKHSDIDGRFQIVEGHSRLGYLRALNRLGANAGCELAKEHLVYVLRRKR